MLNWLFRIVVVVALLVFAGVGYIAYPQWTLKWIAAAAQSGDVLALEAMIDWTKVRAGLKADINRMALKEKMGGADGFAAIGALIGTAAIDRMVDVSVGPEALIERVKENPGALPMEDRLGPPRFSSLRMFVVPVRAPDSDEYPVSLVLELDGVSWRLTRVLIEPGFLDRFNSQKP